MEEVVARVHGARSQVATSPAAKEAQLQIGSKPERGKSRARALVLGSSSRASCGRRVSGDLEHQPGPGVERGPGPGVTPLAKMRHN